MDIFNSYVSLPEGNDGLMIINMKMGYSVFIHDDGWWITIINIKIGYSVFINDDGWWITVNIYSSINIYLE